MNNDRKIKDAAYRKRNRDKINKKNKERVERDYKGWLIKCFQAIRKNKKRKYDIDLDFLLKLWQKQKGKCAISGMKMEFKFNSLRSCSVDRIDSSKEYIKDNVQLVCQWANYGKNNKKNEEMLKIIKELKGIK